MTDSALTTTKMRL